MSRIALLTRSYLNSQSANAICAGNIAEAFISARHDVSIISYENIGAISGDKSVRVISLEKGQTESDGVLSRATGLIKLINGQVDQIIDQNVVDLYYEKLRQLEEQDGSFDIVVSFMFPLESVQAVTAYKKQNPRARSVVYELDSTGDGISQSRFPALYNRAVEKWLHGIYQVIDKIIIMQSHKEYWFKCFGSAFRDKASIADIPVLKKRSLDNSDENQEIRMLYSGLIEKKYRSPSYLLSVLRELSSDLQFEFFFYSKGDCEEEIAKAAETISAIKQMGYVSKDVLDDAIGQATILVSIGNSNSRSVPSKLIHYMAFGKPILHFSSQRDDVCKEYLEKYPLALVIDEWTEVRSASLQIKEFVDRVDGQTVDYDTVSELFYMNDPQYSAKMIADGKI